MFRILGIPISADDARHLVATLVVEGTPGALTAAAQNTTAPQSVDGVASSLHMSVKPHFVATRAGRSSMEFVAIIVLAGSILVIVNQARRLERQTPVGNEIAGTQAHRAILVHWKVVLDVFIEYPELRAYYFDETQNIPNAIERLRLTAIATEHANWLNTGLVTTRKLAYYESAGLYTGWNDYITRVVESSSVIRSTIRDLGHWPSLEPHVSRYDESHTAPLKADAHTSELPEVSLSRLRAEHHLAQKPSPPRTRSGGPPDPMSLTPR